MSITPDRFTGLLDDITEVAGLTDAPDDREAARTLLRSTVAAEVELHSLADRIRFALDYECPVDVPDGYGLCIDCGRRVIPKGSHSPWPSWCVPKNIVALMAAVVRVGRSARLLRSLLSGPAGVRTTGQPTNRGEGQS